jgi:hypothetical protein
MLQPGCKAGGQLLRHDQRHRAFDFRAVLGAVKARRCAPPAYEKSARPSGLDGACAQLTTTIYAMA